MKTIILWIYVFTKNFNRSLLFKNDYSYREASSRNERILTTVSLSSVTWHPSPRLWRKSLRDLAHQRSCASCLSQEDVRIIHSVQKCLHLKHRFEFFGPAGFRLLNARSVHLFLNFRVELSRFLFFFFTS